MDFSAPTHGGPVTLPFPRATELSDLQTNDKAALRKALRARRRAHAAALDPRVAALVFRRPPGAVLDLIAPGATVGLYHAQGGEAPSLGYAQFLHEAGFGIALPAFASKDAPMTFRRWDSPWLDELLEPGPFGQPQPAGDGRDVVPEVLIAPLVGFTADGARLGQGGGYYDRWLAEHPGTLAIGIAWDCQLVDELPREPHDRDLDAVVTPTRLYGPWDRTA